MSNQTEHEIRIVFIVSLVLKAIGSFFEMLAGIVFFLTGGITAVFGYLIQIGLIANPQTPQFLPYFVVHSKILGAIYLFMHGLIKMILIINLIDGKLWAYPAMLWVLSIFITYQIYEVVINHSVLVGLLTLFDIFVLWLVWHEWKIAKKFKK